MMKIEDKEGFIVLMLIADAALLMMIMNDHDAKHRALSHSA
jgi:hypothetical protein